MPGGSNPGWVTGQIPTATEWNDEWSSKQDFDANNPAPITGAIAASGSVLAVSGTYTWTTSAGAYSATLPALSTVLEGQQIIVQDGDNNASVNNITVLANGADTNKIAYYATDSSSFVINVNNSVFKFVRSNGLWRVLQA